MADSQRVMKSTGYILNGIYYSGTQPAVGTAESDSSTYKAYGHDRQRENHRRDMIQPYKDGRLNPEFIQEYPKEARDYGFNQE